MKQRKCKGDWQVRSTGGKPEFRAKRTARRESDSDALGETRDPAEIFRQRKNEQKSGQGHRRGI